MTIEQYKSLSEDEIDLIWFCINKINPPILKKVEIDPEHFVCIKHRYFIEKLNHSRSQVKEEYLPLFDGLIKKLSVA